MRATRHGPNYGKVALVRMFLMMSVGCMQILVGQRHRHAEKMGCDFGPRTLNPSPILKPVTYFGNHPFLRLTGPRVYMIVHRRGFVPSSAPRDPSFARWGDFGRLRRPSRRSRPRHIIRHYLQLLERPNVAVVTGGYPTHVPDPLSRRGHAIWRFMPHRAAGRFAAYDLSDGIGADSRHSAFHWLRYLLR